MEWNVKHLLLRKTDFLKTSISRKGNLKKCTNFEEQKGTRYTWRNVYSGIIVFCCLLSAKSCLRFLLNCFVREIKRFYRSSFGNQVDFRDIINVSLNILVKNQNLKKLRHDFPDERAMIKTTLISFCHWKTLVPFCLRKKRPENVLLTLTVNYPKILQKNKLCHSKQQFIGYLKLCDVIQSLLFLIEKLAFFNKQQ